jgi:indole-3-glycerol phosphate synthase
LIRAEFRPAELARELEAAGAAALSVLTDEEFFQGSLDNLRVASAAVKVPCLRKDFIVDEFQLLEARANAADAVLLIVAALSSAELESLHDHALAIGLEVLVEVHDGEELDSALAHGAEIIGINNRDLRDFSVDMERTARLMSRIPASATVISESGISTPEQLRRLRGAGVHAVLVGETLMRSADPAAALEALTAPGNAADAI